MDPFVCLCIERCVHVYVGVDVVMHVSQCVNTCVLAFNVFVAEFVYVSSYNICVYEYIYICMCTHV